MLHPHFLFQVQALPSFFSTSLFRVLLIMHLIQNPRSAKSCFKISSDIEAGFQENVAVLCRAAVDRRGTGRTRRRRWHDCGDERSLTCRHLRQAQVHAPRILLVDAQVCRHSPKRIAVVFAITFEASHWGGQFWGEPAASDGCWNSPGRS